jgi:hypothetical protein
MPEADAHQGNDLRTLITQAEQLQSAMNLFCALATAQRVTLPRSLHDAAAALLLLPEQLRQAAQRNQDYAALRDGVRRAAEQPQVDANGDVPCRS